MTFVRPAALLLAMIVPATLGAYLHAMRRRRRQALGYPSLAVLRSVLPRRPAWQRHLPVGMLLAAMCLLAVAAARPQVITSVPVGRTTIMLAMDESGSMCSTDVLPNRLRVAQAQAHGFIAAQPARTRMGLVVFADFAEVAVPPTTNRHLLDQAVGQLRPGGGTAIGAAILAALDAIAAVDPQVRPVPDAGRLGMGYHRSHPRAGAPGGGPRRPAPGAGHYRPDVIVVLTDGANNEGIAPLDAAAYASARDVRIYTIGFGTAKLASLRCDAGRATTATLGPARGPGARSAFLVDVPTLREIARRTGGLSYTAEDASQLRSVFVGLAKGVGVRKERREMSAGFAAAGALLVVATLAASIRWSPGP